MITKQTRQESFGTITYEPNEDCFTLTSTQDMARLLPEKLSAPLSMHWLVTLRCNARCPYCYALPSLLRPNDKEEILSESEVQSTMKQYAEARIPRLYLTGGEPTLHPFLSRLVAAAYDNNIRCVVNTNGIKLSEGVYEALVAYQSRISISLDSYVREVHNTTRKQNSFDSIVALLKKAAQDSLDVRIISVMQRDDEAYWLNFGRFLTQHGVGNWFIQAETSKNNLLQTEKLEAKLKQEFPEMHIRVLPAIFNSFMYMLPDGLIGSDIWTPQRVVYGRVPRDSIIEIWQKNEKNRVQDHQGILHINTLGDLK